MKTLILSIVSVLFVQKSGADDNYEFANELVTRHVQQLNRVLVCLDTPDQLIKLTGKPNQNPQLDIALYLELLNDHHELNIEYHNVPDCVEMIDQEIKNKTILSVIAPKPFQMSSDIPMYFYDTPYKAYKNEEDVDAFRNGLFPLRNNHSLKHAFRHYISVHGWKRVAIVSDDAYYSQEFETELVEHLKEKEIVYNVQRCTRMTTSGGCNFAKALNYISGNQSYIIIGNIERANARNLQEAARARKMTSNRFVWIVRDMPFDSETSFYHLVSMTLSPYPAPNDTTCDKDGPALNSVRKALALVSFAVKNVHDKTCIDYFYTDMFQQMHKKHQCDLSKTFVRKFSSKGFVNMKTITVHNSGRIESPYPMDPIIAEVKDLEDVCLQRTKSFENPCYDNYIVYICLVWFVLIILIVLIVSFFTRYYVWM